MLQSMVNNYRPTRAEVTDVANAIFEESDAVMLSEETVKGRYPVKSVRMLSKIARDVELGLVKKDIIESRCITGIKVIISDAISSATCQVAEGLSIKTIITCTQTRCTTRFVSRHRPKQLILAVTPSLNTYRRLALVWGVMPMLIEPIQNTDYDEKKY